MGLPELVALDQDDMVRIAKRVGTDAGYRTHLRDNVAANRMTAPLFDTARYTRDFESAVELIVQRHRSGLAPDHIDVPDQGPVRAAADNATFIGNVDALQSAFAGCPMCDNPSEPLGFANSSTHVLWHEPLPTSVEWKRCTSCEHVHSRHYWTAAGVIEVARKVGANLPVSVHTTVESRRASWTPTVEKVVQILGGCASLRHRSTRPIWVDVGTGDGALVMAALDYGFGAIGVDTKADLVERIQELGFSAMQQDFTTLRFELTPDVLSMNDVLAQLPYPRQALCKAAEVLAPGGVLVLSTPDRTSVGWKLLESARANPYWADIERFHVFSREQLMVLLAEVGFEVVNFSASGRETAQLELYAVRKPAP
jgi:hypothetical protein